MRNLEDLTTDHYTLHDSLCDLIFVAVPRVLSALFAILVSYNNTNPRPESPFDLYHENGYKKSKTELEIESLGEPFAPKIRRFLMRPAFACEFFCFATGTLAMIKCLARLNVEIGVLRDSESEHPLFWVALSMTAFCSLIEASLLESAETVANTWGRRRRRELQERGQSASLMERFGRNLTQPLLSTNDGDSKDEDEEQSCQERGSRVGDRVISDINGDADYKATFSDLLGVCAADAHLVLFASVFLLLAAVCNTLVPHYTGKVLDALVASSSDNNPNPPNDDNGSGILHIPGFVSNIEKLMAVSILGGIFAGVRSSIFTLVCLLPSCLRIRLLVSSSILTLILCPCFLS